MLCENTYTKAQVKACRSRFQDHVAAFDAVGKKLTPRELAGFEPHYFNNLVLALETHFMHRARGKEGKNGNALNEVRMLATALTRHDGTFSGDSSIKYDPARAVTRYGVGDRVALTRESFVSLAEAFFREIEAKYV
jgi:hypothetical protein